jgi:hypothetical protein
MEINKSNIPNNCRECQNDKTCMTYYGSNVCRDKWQTVDDCKSESMVIEREAKQNLHYTV